MKVRALRLLVLPSCTTTYYSYLRDLLNHRVVSALSLLVLVLCLLLLLDLLRTVLGSSPHEGVYAAQALPLSVVYYGQVLVIYLGTFLLFNCTFAFVFTLIETSGDHD